MVSRGVTDAADALPASVTGAFATLAERVRTRLPTLVVAVLAALAVYLLATRVFPYHSTNHDEAVYLTQAAMLLEGQLFLDPPVTEAFRPWFFVEEAGRLYPKYSPVPAAVFAVGMALGDPRLSLAAVAGVLVLLTAAVVREVFDRRTAVAAAVLFAASPLFLIDTAVFLPYAPTTALNLGFAWAYLRADRLARQDDAGESPWTHPTRWAALAGAAVGLAFFARPYTAVLFATPFIVHALWTLRGVPDGDRTALSRQGTTAALGLAGVAVTLGYNALVTGSPFVFPYEAFAPRDGLGFGHRQILGYERDYTPALALEANATALWRLGTEWLVAGPVGTALALAGLGTVCSRPLRGRSVDPRTLVLAGIVPAVLLGNVYFWGTLNILGDLADPTDGLVRYLGTYYHFDLLVPAAAFGAVALVAGYDRLRAVAARRFDPVVARRVALAVALVSASVLGGAAVTTAAEPVEENADTTAQLRQAYAPVEDREFRNALVFLPTPYGDWLNHPFQALRNDPDFDGPAVYALSERQFAVVDAYPDRRIYRYAYRRPWEPFQGRPVVAHLQPVRHVRGERATVDAELGIPSRVESVSIRLGAGDESAYVVANGTPEDLPLTLTVTDGRATLDGPVTALGDRGIDVDDRDSVRLTAFADYGTGAGFSYRLEVPVASENTDVRVLTPTVEVCRSARRCGGEAAYVPRASRPGVHANVTLRATDGSNDDDP